MGGGLPEKATGGAAAYDLYVPKDTEIGLGRNIIKLGFAVELDKGTCALIRSRSGFAAKGMNGYLGENNHRMDADVITGLIDEDYRGEVGVIVNNHDMPFKVKAGERIAQMLIQPTVPVCIVEVEELEPTDRAAGGFGSTNK